MKGASRALLCALLVALAINSCEAIVKQPRSSDDLPSANSQSSASSLSVSAPSASSGASQSSPQSQSSSAILSSHQSSQSSQQQSAAPQHSSQQSSAIDYPSSNQQASNSYGDANTANSYTDHMTSMPSNTQNSYQAAANSVNMALASSGIYSPQSGSSSGQQQQSSSQPSHVHYFYYPASKDSQTGSSASSSAASQQSQSTGADSTSNHDSKFDLLNLASNSYPSYGASGGQAQHHSVNSQQTGSMYPDSTASLLSSLESSMGAQDANYASSGQLMPSADNSVASAIYSPQSSSAQQQQQQQQNGFGAFNSPQHFAQGSPQQMYAEQQNSQQGQQSQMPFASSPNDFAQQSQQGANQFLNNANNANLHSAASNQPPPQFAHDLSTSGYGGSQVGASPMQSSASYMQASIQQQQPTGHGAQQQVSPDFSSLFNSATNMQNSAASSNSPFMYAQNPFLASLAANSDSFSSSPFLNSAASSLQPNIVSGNSQLQQTQHQPIAQASQSATSSAAVGHNRRYGLSSFIMPVLALAGLSLLIPTMSNINNIVGKRKKRSVDNAITSQQINFDSSINGLHQLAKEGAIGEYMDRVERYYALYKNAVESDECMTRIVCEFGAAINETPGKLAIVTVLEKLAPSWLSGKLNVFKEAALSEKTNSKKMCSKKYVCKTNN